MARQIVFVDDIDGTEGAETVTFSYRGESFEIDLAPDNAARMDQMLGEFIRAARKGDTLVPVSEVKQQRRTKGVNTQRAGREQTQAVREWGRANGFNVSERGRIPADLQEAFDNAHQDRPQRPAAKSINAPAVQTQVERTSAPPALFSAPEVKPAPDLDEDDDDTGGNDEPTEDDTTPADDDTPTELDVTSEGIKVWMQSKGMQVQGVKFPARLAAFKKGHPGVKVNYIKEDKAS